MVKGGAAAAEIEVNDEIGSTVSAILVVKVETRRETVSGTRRTLFWFPLWIFFSCTKFLTCWSEKGDEGMSPK